eukprot:1718063-Pyramimonas_sp.AAC.1
MPPPSPSISSKGPLLKKIIVEENLGGHQEASGRCQRVPCVGQVIELAASLSIDQHPAQETRSHLE